MHKHLVTISILSLSSRSFSMPFILGIVALCPSLFAIADAVILPSSGFSGYPRNNTAATLSKTSSTTQSHQSQTTKAAYRSWDPMPFQYHLDDPNRPVYYQMGDEDRKKQHSGSLWESFLSWTEYARKPICTTDYSSFVATQPVTTAIETIFIGPSTGSTPGWGLATGKTTTTTLKTAGAGGHCCGTCDLFYWSVDMFYWPVATPTNTWCISDSSTTAGTMTALSDAELGERAAEPLTTEASDEGVYATDTDGFV